MTELRVSEAVGQAFPRLCIGAVVARGFDGQEAWPQADAELAALEKAARDGHTLLAGESDPHIAAWYAAYRAFGTNPKRERPSVDALRRRLARSARLPRINAAVDCYNLVSVSHGVRRARSTWTRCTVTSWWGSRLATRSSRRSANRTAPSIPAPAR